NHSERFQTEEFHIVDETEYLNKVSTIISKHFSKLKDDGFEGEFVKGYYERMSEFSNSVCQILNQPEVLKDWQRGKRDEKEKCLTWKDLFQFCDFDTNACGGLEQFEGASEKAKWFQNFRDLFQMYQNLDHDSFNDLEAFSKLVLSLRLTPPKKEEFFQIALFFKEIAKLKDFFKKRIDSLELSLSKEKKKIFFNLYQNLINEVSHSVNEKSLFSFSDIERLAEEFVQNPQNIENLAKAYHYFVIDEFQDTSWGQFKTLYKMGQEDNQKFYFVGDIKQSIYRFRGGEIEVFMNAGKILKHNLSLDNNYRSSSRVIEFNNDLFDNLFSKGSLSSHFRKQKVPETASLDGKVFNFIVKTNLEKTDDATLIHLETQSVLKQIKSLRTTSRDDSIAVLLRKVKDGRLLAIELSNMGIPFKAQLKLEAKEVPILSLFRFFLETLLFEDLSLSDRLLKTKMKSFMKFFNSKEEKNLYEVSFNNITNNYRLLGLKEGFKKFVFDIPFLWRDFESHFSVIDIICKIGEENLQRCFDCLNSDMITNQELTLSNSPRPKVELLSVHSSKGLEFDHIFFLNFFGSVRKQAQTNLFGKKTESFKVWNDELKKFIPSFELLVESKKEFLLDLEESKRLLYVALTRAVKSINYTTILDGSDQSCFKEDSWLEWVEENSNADLIDKEVTELHLDTTAENALQGPFFHRINSLGEMIETKNFSNAILSDLSVTKLSDLIVCPRLFYFNNIIKLDSKFWSVQNNEPQAGNYSVSSAERGIEVHKLLEDYFLEEGEDFDVELRKILSPSFQEKAKNLKSHSKCFPEFDLKFQFGSTMLSGTIDLLVESNQGEVKLVDYKTGSFTQEKNSKYTLQLCLYALGIMRFKKLEFKEITLELWYLDHDLLKAYTLTKEDLLEIESFFWEKLTDLNRPNLSSCGNCSFREICH
ncbi:MAG: PD-(D/E)XK nuclease family protein, partial [Bacteriovoracaceae bacterium]